MKNKLKYFILLPIVVLSAENHKVKSNLDILNDENEIDFVVKKTKTALELEDDYYRQLSQINVKNIRLPALTLSLAQKHIDAQEYLMAQYYVKIYLRDYSLSGHMDKAWYLGLKSLFMKFKTSESQKGFLKEITKISQGFSRNFPQSKYREDALKILDEARIIQYNRNEDIANYYKQIGKTKAAKLYHDKNNNPLINLSPLEIKLANQKRIKKIKSNLDVLDDRDSY